MECKVLVGLVISVMLTSAQVEGAAPEPQGAAEAKALGSLLEEGEAEASRSTGRAPVDVGYVDVDPATGPLSILNAGFDISMTPFDLTESNYLDPEFGVWAEELRALGIRVFVFLERVLFEPVVDESSGCQWQDVDGIPGPDPFKTVLRADWELRLADLIAAHESWLSTTYVRFLIVNAEANNFCVPPADTQLLATTLEALLPEIPLAMAWGRTYMGEPPSDDPGVMPRPAPTSVPVEIDILGMWSYAIYDISDPAHPKNANDRLYDPEWPENPNTEYGHLLSLMTRPEQRAMIVFDSMYDGETPGHPHQLLGWTPDDLGDLALNYGRWAARRKELSGFVGWNWRGAGTAVGLEELIGLSPWVHASHQRVTCMLRHLGRDYFADPC